MAAAFSPLGSSLPTRWKTTEDGLGQREVEREDGGGGEKLPGSN